MIHPSTVLVEIPWSATTDKNGNGVHTENLGKDGWYNLAVSGITSGNAYWTLSKNLSFLRPAYGSQIHMPVGITAPGSRIDITVTAGPANASVSGLIYGQRALKPTYLTDIGGLDDYATNTQLGTGQTLLGIITTPGDGLPHTQTFPVQSASTQAVGWSVSFAGSFHIPVSLKILGDVTQAAPVQINTPAGFTFASGIGRWQLPDLNATCTVTDDGTHPSQVYFLAYNFEPIMNVRVGAGDPILPVSLASASPASWQAPLSAGTISQALPISPATVNIITGNCSALHTMFAMISSAVGQTAVIANASGTIMQIPLNAVVPVFFDFKGFPCNPPVTITQDGGAAVFMHLTQLYF